MATYSQTPGLLNIKGVVGTHFSCQLDFNADLTAYTFDSAIVLQEYPSKREQSITVTVNNAAQGIITLSLDQMQTASIGAISKKKWYLNWTLAGLKYTILAGTFELSDIPLGQNEVVSTEVTINTQEVDITLSAFSNAALDSKQPLNAALTQISNLTPVNDDFLQRKSGAWTNRSIAQVKTDLAINNVNNTSDADKPLSNSAINALSYKVNTSQISAFGYTLVDDVDAATARGTLGFGTAGFQNLNPVNGGVVYSGAANLAITPAGTSGQIFQSNGAAAPAWVNLSSVVALNPTDIYATADNSSATAHYPVFVSSTGSA
jgi:hypothetical protein